MLARSGEEAGQIVGDAALAGEVVAQTGEVAAQIGEDRAQRGAGGGPVRRSLRSRRGAPRGLRAQTDDDPLSGVANFFDLGVVFALGFMLALIGYSQLEQRDVQERPEQGEQTPEQQQKKLDRYRVSTSKGQGKGQRLGVAWRLESGEVVYVPEGQAVTADGQIVPAQP